jgi:hypothetical protein
VIRAWEAAFIREAEEQAALAERQARERVLRMEVESVAVLASARGEAEGFTRRIALLEGELMEAHQVHDTTEVNCRGLSDTAAYSDQRWEEAQREC